MLSRQLMSASLPYIDSVPRRTTMSVTGRPPIVTVALFSGLTYPPELAKWRSRPCLLVHGQCESVRLRTCRSRGGLISWSSSAWRRILQDRPASATEIVDVLASIDNIETWAPPDARLVADERRSHRPGQTLRLISGATFFSFPLTNSFVATLMTKEFVTQESPKGIAMPRRASTKPTEAELEILQVLWRESPATVRQVNREINRDRRTGYTTTLKLMQIMLAKGLLTRDMSARPQVYSPAVSRDKAQRQLVGEMLEKVFEGSASQLVMQVLSAKKATPQELTEIRRLIRKYGEERK